MYEKRKKYAIILKKKITYTGIILDEDKDSIRMHTIKDEDIIIYKSEIETSLLKRDQEKEEIEGTGYRGEWLYNKSYIRNKKRKGNFSQPNTIWEKDSFFIKLSKKKKLM